MKVLMISGDPLALNPKSGVYKRLLLQAAQTDFLTVFTPDGGEPSLRRGTLRTEGSPPIPLNNQGIVRGFYGGKLRIAWGMIQAARREQFDIVTAQDPFFFGHIAFHIARGFFRSPTQKVGLQFQIHGDIFSLEFKAQSIANRLKVWWALYHLRRADCIRVVSNRIKDSLVQRGIKAPISVLPIFIDLGKFRAIVRQPHSEKNILWVGRFETEKNPLEAITVFTEVLQAEPQARLVMLGDGSLRSDMAEVAKNLSVTFPGWTDTIPYLETANVVLCTSLHESWGASMVEALAAGVPVVAPDVGIAKESGAIVVPRDQLAATVADVLKSAAQGELKLQLPNAEEWARQWYAGLQQCCQTSRRSSEL